jgi:hypothetical protein
MAKALMRFRGSLSRWFSCKSKDTFESICTALLSKGENDFSVLCDTLPCRPGGTCSKRYFGKSLSCLVPSCVAKIETNVDHLRTKGPAGFVDHIQTQWECSVVEASSVDVRVPSKHITGAAYVNSDKRSSAKNDMEIPIAKRESEALQK